MSNIKEKINQHNDIVLKGPKGCGKSFATAALFIRPNKLDSLFPIHQILCLRICGRVVIFHYSLYSNLSSNIQIFIKSLKKLVKTCKNRIMKVEVAVLKPMQAGDGKQGIKFAWP